MKTAIVAPFLLAGVIVAMPAEPLAAPRGSQIVNPKRSLTVPRPPTVQNTPGPSDKLADMPDCAATTAGGAPRAKFDDKRRELLAAGVSSGALRFEKTDTINDRPTMQAWEKFTLVATGGCSPRVDAVLGPINQAWWARPRLATDWGQPEHDTQGLPGGGMMQRFLARVPGSAAPGPALLVWSSQTNAFSVEGRGLVDRYLADGGPEGVGYPLNNTTWTGEGAYYNDFRRLQDGDLGTLYARPDEAAHRVMGGIHAFWREAGREQSFLGWPRSSEMSVAAGQARQAFEGGVVLWDNTVGARVETPPYQLLYRGFTTLSQSNDQIPDPESAEYTFFVGAVPRTGGETRHTRMPTHDVEYGSMRVGRWRSDEVVVYSGTADALFLTITGLERDSGSPDELLPTIRMATEKMLKTVGSAVGGLIGGPAGAAGGGEIAGIPAEPLAKAIHESFDLGPEMLRPRYYVLNLATLRNYVQTPARHQPTAAGSGAPWHFHVDLHNNEGDHARLFFEVVPGSERNWFGR